MKICDTKEQLYSEIESTKNRVKNVLNYIKDNPESDPNAFEMNDLMFEVAHIGWQGRKFEEEAYDFLKDEKYKLLRDSFTTMMDFRMNQLENNKDLDCNSLNEYFENSLYFSSTLNPLGNEKQKELLNSLCGVNIYIHQRVRDINDDEIIYDNANEYERINQGLEDVSDFNTNKVLVNNIEQLKEEIDKNYLKTKSEVIDSQNKRRR